MITLRKNDPSPSVTIETGLALTVKAPPGSSAYVSDLIDFSPSGPVNGTTVVFGPYETPQTVTIVCTNGAVFWDIGKPVVNYLTFETNPLTGEIRTSAAGIEIQSAAINPFYHFHGFAGNQMTGDPKFFDLAAGNHGVFGANLSNAQAFSNSGYISTVDPATGVTDSVVRLPSLNFDYSGGEKLIVWWLGAVTPEGSDSAIMGDGTGTTAGQHGIRVRAKTTGKFDIAMYGATSTFSGASDGVVFDGSLHSLAFVFDGSNKTHGLWSDEVYQAAFGSAYGLFSTGTDFDTKTANTFNIGAASAPPGTTDGTAVKTRAFVVMRLPAAVAMPPVATMTALFKQLRASPSRLVAMGAL